RGARGLISSEPLLRAAGVSRHFGRRVACNDVSLDIHAGEVVAIVGESGSGKTTLLKCLAAELAPCSGRVDYWLRDGTMRSLHEMPETELRTIRLSDWGFVYQDPSDGLRMTLSAGANIGEKLLALGGRHYGSIRTAATTWLDRVEIDSSRIDDRPRTFSGGMRQRLQIARNLVSSPRLVFMDEPTGGLDVSVQARLLDLLRRLVWEMQLAAIIVTHDLAVARLLSHRLVVMRSGNVVETGLTDRVLDDPQHPYTQLLVSSILQA